MERVFELHEEWKAMGGYERLTTYRKEIPPQRLGGRHRFGIEGISTFVGVNTRMQCASDVIRDPRSEGRRVLGERQPATRKFQVSSRQE